MNKNSVLDHAGKQHCSIYGHMDAATPDGVSTYGIVVTTLAHKLKLWLDEDIHTQVRSDLYITVVRSNQGNRFTIEHLLAALCIKEPDLEAYLYGKNTIYKRECAKDGKIIESHKLRSFNLTIEIVPAERRYLTGKNRLAFLVRQHQDLMADGIDIPDMARLGAISLEVAELRLGERLNQFQPCMMFWQTDYIADKGDIDIHWMVP